MAVVNVNPDDVFPVLQPMTIVIENDLADEEGDDTRFIDVEILRSFMSDHTAAEHVVAGDLVAQAGRYDYANVVKFTAANPPPVLGIATHEAYPGQPLRVVYRGSIELGDVLETGKIYIGNPDGKLVPAEDLQDGWFVNVIGIAATESVLAVDFLSTNVQYEADDEQSSSGSSSSANSG